MMRFIIAAASVILATKCLAIGTVYVTLSYKLDGVAKQDVLVLGVGGKQTPDHDNSSESAWNTVGSFDWSFDSASGYDIRFGVDRGYKMYCIGRKAGMAAYKYSPTEGGYAGRMYFGTTYQLDISSDTWVTNRLTDVFVHASDFGGKKITNMTGGDITIGVGTGGGETIANNSAKIVPDVVTRIPSGSYNASWEVHSEQDWSTTFTPYEYLSGTYSVSKDFPHFANIVFYKAGDKPTIHDLAGALVYGDMSESSGTNVLHGSAGYPLYSIKDFLDAITVMTEWVFDESVASSPHAYLNEEDVCSGHSTTHIIDYRIASTANWTLDLANNTAYIDFTMQLQGSGSYAVTTRCWITGYSTYADAPEGKRASSDGYVGDIATFRLTKNMGTGEVTLELQ